MVPGTVVVAVEVDIVAAVAVDSEEPVGIAVDIVGDSFAVVAGTVAVVSEIAAAAETVAVADKDSGICIVFINQFYQ